MTKIKLPNLPGPSYGFYNTPMYSPEEVRQIQMDTARVVLEAAAQAAGPEDSFRDEWFAAKADAVKRIRALEFVHD